MASVMPATLAGLNSDTRDAALMLAVEIVTTPQPIAGLTTQQTKLVQVLRAVPGRWVAYDALAQAMAADPLDPPDPLNVSTVLCQMRGHPLRDYIELGPRGRGNRGRARWVG